MKKFFKEGLIRLWKDESGIFPVLGIVAAVLSTGTSIATGIVQNKAQKKAERARRGAEELEAQRARIQAVREARIRRAETAAAGEAQGASTSSAVQGAQASIGTQLSSNLGFVESQSAANRTISRANLTANRAATINAVGQSAAVLGQSFLDFRQRQQQARSIEEANAATRVNTNG